MAKIIVSSRYVRNTPNRSAANLVRYMGTREGVEKVPVGIEDGPATVRQQRLIKDLLETDADAKNTFEYQDYENNPTKQNATEFIDAFIERNADRTGEIDKLVKYMAERPSVEKLGPHGLFNQYDDKIDLDSAAEEVGQHQGVVWTHVVSLHREDAERLGYNKADVWKDLVRRNMMELAKAHQIDLDQLQWYAAFHNTTHHPHIHLLVYAKDARQGWLSKKGIDELRNVFGNDIFRFEQQKLFRMETELRDKLKDEVEEDLFQKVVDARNSYAPTPEAVLLLRKLASQLKKQSGKKVYAYLPKEVKQTVDQIVAELARSDGISGLYKEWNEINREKLSLYREKKEPDLPLEDNPEFRSIKNKIIKAVLELPLPEDYDFASEADLHATEEELKYAAQAEKQGEHFYPLHDGSVTPVTEVTQMTENQGAAYAALYHTDFVFAKDYSIGVKVPACIPKALIGLASALASMMGESQHRRLSKLRTQVDHKLRSKIEEKKRAHGLKTDGSLQEYDPEQSM